jgi:iron-sulfur cluster assembly protein
MFEVTEKASEKIKEFLDGREGIQSIRILVTDGGWRGPYLVMALDEQMETDQVFMVRGATFLVEKTLFDRAKPISIDYVLNAMGGGYILKSELLKPHHPVCEGINETC